MKSKSSPTQGPSSLARYVALSLGLALTGASMPSVQAASGTWLGTTDNLWSNGTNWSAGAPPVTGDTATFSNDAPTVFNRTLIDLGAGQAAATVVFDTTAAAAYTIGAGAVGSQTLTLDTTGAVTLGLAAASAPATNQLFNANVVLGTGAAGTTTFTNNATAASGVALTFAGTVTGGTGGTAGIKTLNTAGTGAINFTNALGAGGGTVLNLSNLGVQTVTLSGAATSNFSILRATAAAGQVVVNGQTVVVAANSAFGTSSNAGSKFILNSGSAAFNGGIQSVTQGGTVAGNDGMAFIINGGTFTTSLVALGRSGSFSTVAGATTATAITLGANGFQVNGGTATVTGAVSLLGSNSAANGQVSGTGNLTVGGEFSVGGQGNTGTQRTTLFQVTGGTFTNTDTAGNGIVISRGNTVASSGELLLTGGTTTTNKIAFGVAGGVAGSFGNITINGAGANLYVGNGGIVLNSTNAFTNTINLTAGTLGATADWTSALNMNFNGAAGTSFTVQAADAGAVAHNITLTGALGGTGGLTKTGAGTLTLTAANSYSGLTTVNAGALNINGVNALGGANYNGLTFNGGTLQYNTAAATANNGSLDISNIGGTAKPVTIGGAATIDTNGNAVTFANTIGNGGAGSLTKTGAGVLTFAAAANYTGATNINAGTLTLSTGSVASTNVNVTGNGVLTLNNAAALSDLGTLSLVSGTTLNLNGTAGTTETIGSLILNGMVAPIGTYTATQLAGLAGANGITFTGSESLFVTAVPEPSTWAMMVAGLLGLGAMMRRRRTA